MTTPGTNRPRGGVPELERAHRDYLTLAARMANDRIRKEVGPTLEQRLGVRIPRGWNPVRRIGSNQVTDLTMILDARETFSQAILADKNETRLSVNLYTLTEKIVVDSLEEAFVRNTHERLDSRNQSSFLAAILRDLMKEDGKVKAESNEWPDLT